MRSVENVQIGNALRGMRPRPGPTDRRQLGPGVVGDRAVGIGKDLELGWIVSPRPGQKKHRPRVGRLNCRYQLTGGVQKHRRIADDRHSVDVRWAQPTLSLDNHRIEVARIDTLARGPLAQVPAQRRRAAHAHFGIDHRTILERVREALQEIRQVVDVGIAAADEQGANGVLTRGRAAQRRYRLRVDELRK